MDRNFYKSIGWLVALCLSYTAADGGLTRAQSLGTNTPRTTYQFFPGLLFPPFPGTLPQSAQGAATGTVYPLVAVPTPGLRAAGPAPQVNRGARSRTGRRLATPNSGRGTGQVPPRPRRSNRTR
jgi:hypothetical protein